MAAVKNQDMPADLVDGWRVEQERSGLIPASIRRRCDDIRGFRRFLDGKDLLDATRDDVNAWLDSRPLSAKTRYNLISTLACFYRWAVLEEFTEHNPTERIRRPKLRRYLPRPMPATDLEVALRTAHPRMQAWILLGALAGLRCMEISNLDTQDILLEPEPVMVVRGKGGKERIVPLHPILILALQHTSSGRPGPVFVNSAGGRYSPAAVSQQINAFLHGLGIDATAHQLRHRFGTDVYRLSRDLRLTQELLGHASSATTSIYAAWSPAEGASVVGRLAVPVGAHV